MRTKVRLLGLFVGLVALVLWFFGGPNLGWTKTRVAIEKIDEVTDQRYVTWEKRFLPGVDFLGAGLAAGAALFAAGFCFKPGARAGEFVGADGKQL